MKKVMTIFGAVFIASVFLISCGGKKSDDKDKKENETKEAEYTLSVEPSMSGDLSKDFEVTKAILKVEQYGSKLLVEIKRTQSELSFDAQKAAFDGEGVAQQFEYDVKADVLGENDAPLETSLGHSKTEPFVSMRSLKPGETVWLEFSAYGLKDAAKAKKVKLTSSLEKRDLSSSSSSSDDESSDDESTTASGGDCEQFCNDYEAVVDDYIAIYKKQKANPNDISIVTEAADVMSRVKDMEENIEKCKADAAFASRITKIAGKLSKALSSL